MHRLIALMPELKRPRVVYHDYPAFDYYAPCNWIEKEIASQHHTL